jgi:hypothetical protein
MLTRTDFSVMTMVINEIQVLTGGLPLVGAPQSLDGIMASSMESSGNWSVDLKEWEAPYHSFEEWCGDYGLC